MPVWVNFAEQDNRFCLLGKKIEFYRTYLPCIRSSFTLLYQEFVYTLYQEFVYTFSLIVASDMAYSV